MQLAGALLAAGALFAALDRIQGNSPPFTASWWWLFGAGLFILCGSGLLGTPWAVVFVLVLMFRPGFWRSVPRSGMPAIALFGPLLVILAIYYAWTLKEDVRTIRIPMSLPGTLAVFYEQLGFLGLGPGRTALRVHSVSALRPFLCPLFLLGLPLAWGLLIAACRRFEMAPARFATVFLISCIVVGLIFGLGYLRQVRLLARHFTPFFPLILVGEAYAILLLWRSERALKRGAAVLIVACLIVSSLETRFAFRHSKDDYRGATAAAAAALAQGKTVWWVADPDGTNYYHLPIAPGDLPGTARWIPGAVPADSRTPPDLIFISRPDIYDHEGSISAFIAAHQYHPVAEWKDFRELER
jgi:hypothetical protein